MSDSGPLTEDETMAVIKAAVGASGGQSEEDLIKVADWAGKARINACMLQLVLLGEAGMYVDADGELIMKARQYWPSQ